MRLRLLRIRGKSTDITLPSYSLTFTTLPMSVSSVELDLLSSKFLYCLLVSVRLSIVASLAYNIYCERIN